jgi:RimJ/RimL family protein N-acetyltransferase
MTTLTTARLRLEPFDERHYDGIRAINSNPEVMRYITGRAETPEETHAVIARTSASWAELGYSWWVWIEQASGQVIGSGCVQHIERNPANPLELGWRLLPEKQGRGYAIEGARAMAHFAFEDLKAPCLYAVCDPDNKASAGVMQRLGMQFRGIERWYGRDTSTYAYTREQWLALANQRSP